MNPYESEVERALFEGLEQWRTWREKQEAIEAEEHYQSYLADERARADERAEDERARARANEQARARAEAFRGGPSQWIDDDDEGSPADNEGEFEPTDFDLGWWAGFQAARAEVGLN